uniref:G-protein coupled receptors family 1 profile domain-containing protein n=1 Tax=Anopheles epiroticus TaxID=199890 RepID=A0A182P812_9DIPT
MRAQSVTTASGRVCPPSSRSGQGVDSVRQAHHAHPIAGGHGWAVGAGGTQQPDQQRPVGRSVAAGQLNAVVRQHVAPANGGSECARRFRDGRNEASERNKTTPKRRPSGRRAGPGGNLSAVGVRATATVVWIVLSLLIPGRAASHTLDADRSPGNASNAALGNAYGGRFGRLLLNGTRPGIGGLPGGVAVATLITSTASSTEAGPFVDGGVAFVAADGTASAGFNDSSEMPQIPEYIRATSMVFCIIIMCLGVIGNIMVPIVILKTKDMRNSTNIFLTNLSIADLLVLLVCTPTVLVEVNSPPEVWVLGEEMCK